MRTAKPAASPAPPRAAFLAPGGLALTAPLTAPLTALLTALLTVLLAGCRTYGRRDATEKTLPEMRQAVQHFASNLERARSDRDLLRRAARGDSTLRIVAEEYDRAVAQHEKLLNESQDVLSRFEEDLPDYRTMHRAYGALLSKQQTARVRYRSLIKAVRYPGVTTRLEAPGRSSSSDSSAARGLPDSLQRARDESYTEGRYYIAPLFYEQLQSRGNDMTMRQALAERRQRQSQKGRLTGGPGRERSRMLGPGAPPPADSAGRVPRR